MRLEPDLKDFVEANNEYLKLAENFIGNVKREAYSDFTRYKRTTDNVIFAYSSDSKVFLHTDLFDVLIEVQQRLCFVYFYRAEFDVSSEVQQ